MLRRARGSVGLVARLSLEVASVATADRFKLEAKEGKAAPVRCSSPIRCSSSSEAAAAAVVAEQPTEQAEAVGAMAPP